MATLEPDSPTTEVKLVPKLFHNFVGVYQPTDALLEYVQASVPQLKNIQNVHRVFEIDPAILLRSLDPIATDNSPYFVIPLNRMFEDTRKLIRPIWKEFRDFYYPEIFAEKSPLNPLFDYWRSNHSVEPKIAVMREGIIDLSSIVLLVMIPIFETGDVRIQASPIDGGDLIPIEWHPGSVILVPSKSDLILRGKGQLVCQVFSFAQIQFISQRS